MQHLFSEFKPTTAAEWKAQLLKDLKGEPFENLVWQNENGFEVKPFYTSEDLKQPYTPAFTHAGWEICVSGKNVSSPALNEQFLRQLNAGATAISMHCGDHDPETALNGVALNYIQSTFYVNSKNISRLKTYLEKNYELAELSCTLFPEALLTAAELEDWERDTADLKKYPNIKTCSLDALYFHNLDALAYYEVAVILSGLNEYLNVLSKNNARPAQAFVVKTGVSADYFIQMAKLRAIRRLWLLLRAEYNVANDLYLIVETSLTNKSVSDSNNNLLRTTVEAMAAVSGGCNELIVNTFDVFFPVNSTLSERMAVNQQLILKDESYFDKMADVSCGSYYIESMTDAIASKALETIKRFEALGGYFKCVEAHVFTEEIAVQAAERDKWIETGKQVVIGVNKFKNEKENISMGAAQREKLSQLNINNPVLNYELAHYFK